jgi:Zn-dependent protease
MFTDPGRSQWDLNFRLLGIPVRVHPMFWVMSALLGQSALHLGISYLLLWVACVFVSVLIHEMGHVLMARVFDVDGEIVLYGFGGLAIPASQMRRTWQHILVCLAGPVAGFLLLGFVLLSAFALAPQEWEYVKRVADEFVNRIPLDPEFLRPTMKREMIENLLWINLIWGLVNLVPIWPLDGGQISRDIFSMLSPRSGASAAYGISLVLAALIALDCIMEMNGRSLLPIRLPIGGWWTVLMFGYLAVGSYMALQEEQSRRTWMDERVQRWDQDDDGRW